MDGYTTPAEVKYIGGAAFEGAKKITGELVISDNVVEIRPQGAFSGSGFTSVVFGSGLTNIGRYSFGSPVVTYEFRNTTVSLAGETFSNYDKTCKRIIVPDGTDIAAFTTKIKNSFRSWSWDDAIQVVHKSSTTSVERTFAERGIGLTGGKSAISIILPRRADVQIFTLSGAQIYRSLLQAGTHTVTLPAGAYMVQAEGAQKKWWL